MESIKISLLFLSSFVVVMTSPFTFADDRKASTGCGQLINSFCSQLYSPDHQGNLEFGKTPEHFEFRYGTNDNDFSYAYLGFQKAKLEAIRLKRLPADFLKNLDPKYSLALAKYLQSKDRRKMTLSEFNHMTEADAELARLYDKARARTLHDRVEKEAPGYFTSNVDVYGLKENMVREQLSHALDIEIYYGIWDLDSQYISAKAQFEETKKTFLKYIAEHPGIPEKERPSLMDALSSVRLEPPVRDAAHLDLSCGSTNKNAAYTPATHTIRLCAGYFTRTPVSYAIFAHELAHAIGISRDRVEFSRRSELGKKTKELIETVCAATNHGTCTTQWDDYQKGFMKWSEENRNFKVSLNEFRHCLILNPKRLTPIGKPGSKEFKKYQDFIETKAEASAKSFIADLADRNVFISLLMKKLPREKRLNYRKDNPRYLNPCEGYAFLTPELFDMGSALHYRTMFVAEYNCQDPKMSEAKRMEFAIESLQKKIDRLSELYMWFWGDLSDASVMVGRYSEDVDERFADILGGEVLAQMIRQKYPKNDSASLEARRTFFLASSSHLCNEPSYEDDYPELMAIQKKFSDEPHPIFPQRRMDFLGPKTREILDCSKDFENHECSL